MQDTCSKCGAPVDMTTRWVDANGDPQCPNGGEHEVNLAQHAAQAHANQQTGGNPNPPLDIQVPEEEERVKPEIVLAADEQAVISNWHQYFAGTAMTPVAEHEMLEAVSTNPIVRDYLVTELLYGWLSQEIDGVTPVNPSRSYGETLEETLGRCPTGTPERAACEALLFTARLGDRLSDERFMESLSTMPDEDVRMLVEAGAYASTEMQAYINVLVQSVAVTKVTR